MLTRRPPAAPNNLPPPAEGFVLKHVAIGRGTQNYTCDTANATAVPAAAGALATLFNASCVASTYPDLAKLLPRVAMRFNLTSPELPRMAPSNLAISGRHWFTTLTTPFFDLDTPAQRLGAAGCAKNASQPAPADAQRGQRGEPAVPWLKLTTKPGATGNLQEVYRVETVGGSAPASCKGMPATFEVQYSAQYVFCFSPLSLGSRGLTRRPQILVLRGRPQVLMRSAARAENHHGRDVRWTGSSAVRLPPHGLLHPAATIPKGRPPARVSRRAALRALGIGACKALFGNCLRPGDVRHGFTVRPAFSVGRPLEWVADREEHAGGPGEDRLCTAGRYTRAWGRRRDLVAVYLMLKTASKPYPTAVSVAICNERLLALRFCYLSSPSGSLPASGLIFRVGGGH